MTVRARRTRVWLDEGILSAQCDACGIYVERVELGDDESARVGFATAHPEGEGRPHALRLPTGWIRPLSGAGAWSQ